MRREQRPKLTTTVLLWILWNTARLLPLPIAARLLSAIIRTCAHWFTRQSIIRENLAKAFPEMAPPEVKKTARNIAANLGVVAAELCHIGEYRGGLANGRLTFTGSQNLELARHGPVIFVGTHQWNWELAPLLYIENGIDIAVIYAKLGNELFDRTILAARQRTGASYLERRQSVRASIEILRRGGSLALLMDQHIKSGIEVTFFGRSAQMTAFPARLAIRFSCPIVPMNMERRDGHRFHMDFCTPIYPPSADHVGAELRITQAIATEFERIIRRSPETWFCNKRRWPNESVQGTNARMSIGNHSRAK
jgi:KDO2-lipid IV(A) lauroyltransferase